MSYRILAFRSRDREASFIRLLEGATQLFYEQGYRTTTMEAIAVRADLSRGALYHHFKSKRVLFQTVALKAQARIARQMKQKTTREHDPIEALKLTCHALLEGLSDKGPRRVLLLDAPAVLGWEAWREIDRIHIWPVLLGCVEEAMLAGVLPNRPVDELTPLIVGAIKEAALDIGRDRSPWNRAVRMRRALDRLVEDLQGSSEERLVLPLGLTDEATRPLDHTGRPDRGPARATRNP